MSTRLEQIKARVLKLWRWDSPTQGIEYTKDGEPDPEYVDAHARHANGVVDALAAIPPDDLDALLRIAEAAERWEEVWIAEPRIHHEPAYSQWQSEFDKASANLEAAVRAFREGGGEG